MRLIIGPHRPALLTTALAICLLVTSCGGKDEPIEIQGGTMGTTYSIKLAEIPRGLTTEELKAGIDAHLDKVNDLMSTYRPDSELSRFNASRSIDWFPVDPELVNLVSLAQSISAMSNGAFDITVGPLVNLWGFGPDQHPFRVPDEGLITETRQRVGYEKLAFRLEPPALRKAHPDIYVDLSGIAKGYGVDQVAGFLEELGALSYLVEIGGELKAKGTKAGGQPWRIAIERPQPDARAVYRVVALENAALATSGDYRNYYAQDGRLYSHTIDPSTGRPVEHHLASVTVISEDCATADAMATALLVLGEERGFDLAQSEGIAAFFVTRRDDDYQDRGTSAFDGLTTASNGAH
jgi:thiamine biosynthesis lipoprotein